MAPSKKQLLEALEAILPFAEIEIGCLVDYFNSYPDDELAEPERAKQGKEALAKAKAVLAESECKLRRKNNMSDENRRKAAERMKELWSSGKMKRATA